MNVLTTRKRFASMKTCGWIITSGIPFVFQVLILGSRITPPLCRSYIRLISLKNDADFSLATPRRIWFGIFCKALFDGCQDPSYDLE